MRRGRRPLWGILSGYLFRQLAVPTLLGVGGFTLILTLPLFFEALAWARLGGISTAAVGQFLLCFVPRLTILTLPMALLLACLFVYGRMTEEREIDAMLTSGVPYWRVLLPALTLAGLCLLFLLFWCHRVAPRAVEVQRRQVDRIIDELHYPVLQAGQFNLIDNNALFVRQVNPETGALADVVFYGLSGGRWSGRDQAVDYFLCAPYGQAMLRGASRELELTLTDGAFHWPQPSGYAFGTFARGRIYLNVHKDITRMVTSTLSREEGTPTSLLTLQAERCFSEMHRNPKFRARGRRFLIEWHRRFAHPAATVVLVLLGAPLGILTGLGRKTVSFVLAIGILLAYYISSEACVNLAESGSLPVALGVWTAPMLFLLVGLGLNGWLARR